MTTNAINTIATLQIGILGITWVLLTTLLFILITGEKANEIPNDDKTTTDIKHHRMW